MMMPANFSAVSENEMTYVMGGSVVDYLAPVMGTKEWSQVGKNLILAIGNGYVKSFVANTVGTIFNGTYAPFACVNAFGTELSTIWKKNYTAAEDAPWTDKAAQGALGALNIVLDIVGNAAAIYNLGFGETKNYVKENVLSV